LVVINQGTVSQPQNNMDSLNLMLTSMVYYLTLEETKKRKFQRWCVRKRSYFR